MESIVNQFKQLKDRLLRNYDDHHNQIIIQIGSATCENAAGSEVVKSEFQKLIKASGRQDIVIKQTGCTGRCSREPIVGVFVPGQFPGRWMMRHDPISWLTATLNIRMHWVIRLAEPRTTEA